MTRPYKPLLVLMLMLLLHGRCFSRVLHLEFNLLKSNLHYIALSHLTTILGPGWMDGSIQITWPCSSRRRRRTGQLTSRRWVILLTAECQADPSQAKSSQTQTQASPVPSDTLDWFIRFEFHIQGGHIKEWHLFLLSSNAGKRPYMKTNMMRWMRTMVISRDTRH